MLIAAAGSKIVSLISGEFGLASQKEALKIRLQEERLAATQQMINKERAMSRIISEQNVQAGASGVTPGSFAVVQEADFNKFAEDLNAEKLNLKWKEYAIKSQEKQLTVAQYIAPVQTLFDIGAKAASLESGTGFYPKTSASEGFNPNDEIVHSVLS